MHLTTAQREFGIMQNETRRRSCDHRLVAYSIREREGLSSFGDIRRHHHLRRHRYRHGFREDELR